MTDHTPTSDPSASAATNLPSTRTPDKNPPYADNDRPKAAANEFFSRIYDELHRLGKHAIIPDDKSSLLPFSRDPTLTLRTANDQLTFEYDKSRETITDITFCPENYYSTLPLPTDDSWSWGMIPDALTISGALECYRELPHAIERAWVNTETNSSVTELLDDDWKSDIHTLHDDWQDELALARTTATVDDLVTALKKQQYKRVEYLFDADEPITRQTDSDIGRLCDQPVKSVPYQDDDLALIYPEPVPDAQVSSAFDLRGLDDLRRINFEDHDIRELDRLRTHDHPFVRDVLDRNNLHEAYVIGTDDTPTGFFVHPVDATSLDPHDSVSREMIHRIMGFDRSIDPADDHLAPGFNERVRIQGDLRIARTGDVNDASSLVATGPGDITDYLHIAVRQWIGDRGGDPDLLDIELDQRPTGADSDAPTYALSLGPSSTADPVDIIDTCTAILDLSDHHGDSLLSQVDQTPHAIDSDADAYASALCVLAHEHIKADFDTLHERAEELREQHAHDWREMISNAGQGNLPIDNHNIVLQSGYIPDSEDRRTEPIRIIVPETTYMHIIHDEHDQLNIELAEGIYEFSLLPRGIQPPRQRTRWVQPPPIQ